MISPDVHTIPEQTRWTGESSLWSRGTYAAGYQEIHMTLTAPPGPSGGAAVNRLIGTAGRTRAADIEGPASAFRQAALNSISSQLDQLSRISSQESALRDGAVREEARDVETSSGLVSGNYFLTLTVEKGPRSKMWCERGLQLNPRFLQAAPTDIPFPRRGDSRSSCLRGG